MKSNLRLLGIAAIAGLICAVVLVYATQPARAGGTVSGGCTETDLNNALLGGGSINFDCGGPKTINFTSYKQISADTTIDGGDVITFDGQNLTELFQIFPGKMLTLKNITLANANGSSTGAGAIENLSGNLIVINSQVNNSYSPNNGGAIYNSGALTITNSTFKNNRAHNGGAIYNDGGSANVAGSTFVHNVVTTTGGAINNSSGSFVLQTSTLTNSHANDGGAVFVNTGSDILINASNLLSNSAGYGGAIENNGGIITLTASTIDRNRSDNDGGGVWSISGQVTFNGTNVTNNRAGATGGGISNYGDVMSMTNGLVSGNSVNDQGGGIYNAGVMTLTSVTISNNLVLNTSTSSAGGGVYSSGPLKMTGGGIFNNRNISTTASFDGGGIYNNGSMLNLLNVILQGNAASAAGGIDNASGTLILRGGTIYSNTAYVGSGGINNSGSGATATIITSTIDNNYGGVVGGGILQSSGATMTISQTRITRNITTFRGGGLRNFGSVEIYQSTLDNNTSAGGGGIANRGSIYLENSTVSANTATDTGGVFGGGGILSEQSAAGVALKNVTINQNQAMIAAGLQITDVGVLAEMYNTIVANSTNPTTHAAADNCDLGSITSSAGNLISDLTCLNGSAADPLLRPLAFNGGPTPTHLPIPGSPAIDTGSNTYCTTEDQRGKSRPYNVTCDIGSVEFSVGDTIPGFVSVRAAPSSINENNVITLTGTFTDPGTLSTHTVTVSWGDGTLTETLPALGASVYAFTAMHQYLDDNPTGTPSDINTIKLTLSDNYSHTVITTTNVTVNNVPPTVDAGPDRMTQVNAAIQFNGVYTDPGTLDTHTIAWNFGDSSTSTGTLTPLHAYTATGTYTATLTVTDDDTGVGNDSLVVHVKPTWDIYLPLVLKNH